MGYTIYKLCEKVAHTSAVLLNLDSWVVTTYKTGKIVPASLL